MGTKASRRSDGRGIDLIGEKEEKNGGFQGIQGFISAKARNLLYKQNNHCLQNEFNLVN